MENQHNGSSNSSFEYGGKDPLGLNGKIIDAHNEGYRNSLLTGMTDGNLRSSVATVKL